MSNIYILHYLYNTGTSTKETNGRKELCRIPNQTEILPFNVWFYIIMLLQKWYFIIIKSNSSLLVNHSGVNRLIDTRTDCTVGYALINAHVLFLFVNLIIPHFLHQIFPFFIIINNIIIHNGKKCYICTAIYTLHLEYR